MNFVKLTREQQLDVLNRTFHGLNVGRRTMSEPRTGSRYELHLARKGVVESKVAGYHWPCTPATSRESYRRGRPRRSAPRFPTKSAARWTAQGCVSSPFPAAALPRCQYCHNPDTWQEQNGHPVTVSRAMQDLASTSRCSRSARASRLRRRATGSAAVPDG